MNRPCFSPPAWGCSDISAAGRGAGILFPTRVGMFREGGRMKTFRISFPHPRGDVPQKADLLSGGVAFSPPAWGCSASTLPPQRRKRLFPTRVGMFL